MSKEEILRRWQKAKITPDFRVVVRGRIRQWCTDPEERKWEHALVQKDEQIVPAKHEHGPFDIIGLEFPPHTRTIRVRYWQDDETPRPQKPHEDYHVALPYTMFFNLSVGGQTTSSYVYFCSQPLTSALQVYKGTHQFCTPFVPNFDGNGVIAWGDIGQGIHQKSATEIVELFWETSFEDYERSSPGRWQLHQLTVNNKDQRAFNENTKAGDPRDWEVWQNNTKRDPNCGLSMLDQMRVANENTILDLRRGNPLIYTLLTEGKYE